MTWKLFGLILAAGVAFNGAVLLIWVAWCQIIQGCRRRARTSAPAAPLRQCPCGCGRTSRSDPAPGLPVDGDPLDEDEKRRLASVLLGYLSTPDESADERKNHQ